MQSTYLSVILHFEHKKITIHAVFTWFLILGKKQPRPQGFSLKKWVREVRIEFSALHFCIKETNLTFMLVTFKIEGDKQYIFLSANKDPFWTPSWVCSVDLALRFLKANGVSFTKFIDISPDFVLDIVLYMLTNRQISLKQKYL